jgi:hypothetical protein
MANTIASNVWKIDTAPFTYKYWVKIDNLWWTWNTNDITLGSVVTLLITDGAGNVIVEASPTTFEAGDPAVAITPDSWMNQTFGKMGWINGLSIANSGTTGLPTSAVVTINVGGGK